MANPRPPLNPLETWFAKQGWEPAEFQIKAWQAYLNGESGLIHSATGSGKSLAAWGGPLLSGLLTPGSGLRVLWITPLRALANDTVSALTAAAHGVGINWRIEKRTGDTAASVRNKQRTHPPEALVTTPESLSLLLSYRHAEKRFGQLDGVIVDEWHELLGSKRGVQLELCLARLRQLAPKLKVWGLSATLGNLEQARDSLLGHQDQPGLLITGPTRKALKITAALPQTDTRFPWAGHLGTHLLGSVLAYLEEANSSLLFTNTRAQAEIWFESILKARMDWLETLGLHHGSIDRGLRERIEQGLSSGDFRCVVATSSLDLGVDFSPVDRVIQIGSPKGIARLAQRAGRCGHQPDGQSEIFCVPTHALELLEIAAARRAWEAGRIEARPPLRNCLDVLAQHLVSLASGDGFDAEATFNEVRTTHAFADLDPQAWQWTLDFITYGGAVLSAYPDFQRVVKGIDGRYHIATRTLANRHRMSIGTITSDAAIAVKYQSGGHIGTVEERFIARLRPGDRFLFAGLSLELVRVRDLVATVKRSRAARQAVPHWQGGRLPLSNALADEMLELLAEYQMGRCREPEVNAIQPLLELQANWSALPQPGCLLVERTDSREGQHLFLFPFAGRLAHEGIASLLAWRLGQADAGTFSLAVNDYGIEILSRSLPELDEDRLRTILSPANLADDLLASLNAGELVRRQFRDIARVAGLIFQGYPGRGKTARQLQASSGLMFDTLKRYDPENRLLEQATREVLESTLEVSRIKQVLEPLMDARMIIQSPTRLSPFAFPLWAERQRNRLSTERWSDRVAAMVARLEKAAGAA